MITKHSHSQVFVVDQDRAKAFFTEKLGLEVRDDVRMGTYRWLTVAPKTQPDHQIILSQLQPGGLMNADQIQTIRSLLEAGALGGGVFATDDCQRTYEELKAKGVTFVREPKEMPYGIEALFRDDSNNMFVLVQRR